MFVSFLQLFKYYLCTETLFYLYIFNLFLLLNLCFLYKHACVCVCVHFYIIISAIKTFICR